MAEARRINVSGKADDINERNPETLKDRGKSVVSQLRSQGQLVVLGWVCVVTSAERWYRFCDYRDSKITIAIVIAVGPVTIVGLDTVELHNQPLS